jgi:hypothetical protein
VQPTLISRLLVLFPHHSSVQLTPRETIRTHLLLSVPEQFADILLRLTDELVQDLGSIDNLGFPRIEHLANLPRHERLSRARGSIQEDT